MHLEPTSEFIHFLIINNIDRDIVINYLKYHYVDGSNNGSGKKDCQWSNINYFIKKK